MPTAILLPWVRLSQPIKTGRYVFWPFPDSTTPFPLDKDAQGHLRTILSSYVDTKGRPLTSITFVSHSSAPFEDLSTSKAKTIAQLIRLFSFSTITENDYFHEGSACFNSTHFQYFFQRFQIGNPWTAPVSRRRIGSTTHGGYKHGELKFSMPLEVVPPDKARPNIALLRALHSLSRRNSADAQAMWQSINWFLLANSDSYFVTQEMEIIMMASAFEALFEVQKEREKKLSLMTKLPILFASHYSKPSTRKGKDGKRATKPWKAWWIDEFYWLRNMIAHSGTISRAKMIWTLDEHLAIAAMLLSLSVKLKLATNKLYTLTKNEESSADSTDHFIAGGHLSSEKLMDAKMRASIHRATENAWASLFHTKKSQKP